MGPGRMDMESWTYDEDGKLSSVKYFYRPDAPRVGIFGDNCINDVVFCAEARQDIPWLLGVTKQLVREAKRVVGNAHTCNFDHGTYSMVEVDLMECLATALIPLGGAPVPEHLQMTSIYRPGLIALLEFATRAEALLVALGLQAAEQGSDDWSPGLHQAADEAAQALAKLRSVKEPEDVESGKSNA